MMSELANGLTRIDSSGPPATWNLEHASETGGVRKTEELTGRWFGLGSRDLSESAQPIQSAYQVYAESSERLVNASNLLSECELKLAASRRALAEVGSIESDLIMMEVFGIIRELFNYRSLGDGFAAITAALMNAFLSKRGEIFTGPQIATCKEALRKTRVNPFIRFEDAIQVIDELESSGLDVDPPGAHTLLDILIDE